MTTTQKIPVLEFKVSEGDILLFEWGATGTPRQLTLLIMNSKRIPYAHFLNQDKNGKVDISEYFSYKAEELIKNHFSVQGRKIVQTGATGSSFSYWLVE